MLRKAALECSVVVRILMDMEWGAARIEGAPPHIKTDRGIKAKLAERTAEMLGVVRKTCADYGLQSSVLKIDRTVADIDRFDATAIKHFLHEIRERIEDDLAERHFYPVASSDVEYCLGASLFGQEVTTKLPSVAMDVEEAGKCLAFGRSTASVFHVMRVMEVGVQELGRKLGVMNPTEKPWGNLTTEMDAALKQLYPKNATPQQRAEQAQYAGVLSHLNGVRIAWRNPTMHPKQSYTVSEAREIFEHAKAFMRDLAGIL